MKVIKEAINTLPEVTDKAQVVMNPVEAKAKLDSDAAQKEAEKQGAIKAEDAIKQEPITGHKKKDYPKKIEEPKATLDESLFDDELDEGVFDKLRNKNKNKSHFDLETPTHHKPLYMTQDEWDEYEKSKRSAQNKNFNLGNEIDKHNERVAQRKAAETSAQNAQNKRFYEKELQHALDELKHANMSGDDKAIQFWTNQKNNCLRELDKIKNESLTEEEMRHRVKVSQLDNTGNETSSNFQDLTDKEIENVRRYRDEFGRNTRIEVQDETLNEGKEIAAISELAKAAKDILFTQPWKAKEILTNNPSLVRDFIESGLSAEDYLQKECDYYGTKRYADWFGDGCPTKFVKNYVTESIQQIKEGLSDAETEYINNYVESFKKSINEDLIIIPDFMQEDNMMEECPWMLGYCANAMHDCGLSDEIPEMQDRALGADYDNFCNVCDEYTQKCNDIASQYDDDFEYEVDTKDIDELEEPDFYNELVALGL